MKVLGLDVPSQAEFDSLSNNFTAHQRNMVELSCAQSTAISETAVALGNMRKTILWLSAALAVNTVVLVTVVTAILF